MLVMVAVLGLFVGVGFAATGTVHSVNIVGYDVEMVPGSNNFNLVAVQFESFDPTLLGVFGTNQLDAGGFPQQADLVYMLNAGGTYSIYGLKAGTGQFYDTDKWFPPNGPTNPPLHSGSAVWLQSKTGTGPSKTVTLAGEAIPDTVVTNDITTGFQLMAYPFSCERALNDTQLDELGTAAAWPNTADFIYVWNGVGYNTYGLKTGTPNQWYDVNEWFTGAPTTDVIPLGCGFWYEAKTVGFTWVEPNPYLAAYE